MYKHVCMCHIYQYQIRSTNSLRNYSIYCVYVHFVHARVPGICIKIYNFSGRVIFYVRISKDIFLKHLAQWYIVAGLTQYGQ